MRASPYLDGWACVRFAATRPGDDVVLALA